jgi:hypothetical protein
MTDINWYSPRSGRIIKEDGTTVNEANGINTDGSRNVKVMGGKYEDKGLNVEGLNMAAGAVVYGSWIDNVDWVRNLVILAQSDQGYDLVMQRRDTSNAASFDTNPVTGQTTTGGSSSWRTHAIAGASALLGYSTRFGIKNSSASANTFGRLRVQLMGL